MKNSLFIDMVNHCLEKIEEEHKFAVEYGSVMDKVQIDKFKLGICSKINRLSSKTYEEIIGLK